MYRHMPDILLDVPDAEAMARSFVVEVGRAEIHRNPCVLMTFHGFSSIFMHAFMGIQEFHLEVDGFHVG